MVILFRGIVSLILVVLVIGCGQRDSTPSEGRVLRISIPALPSAMDPHLQDEWASRTILLHIYDSLVVLDANMKVVPRLAERWETVGLLDWRFYIRRDVKFHNGRLLTADDVVASIQRALHHPRSEISSFLLEVDSVEKTGDWQVDIRTRRPYPILLNKLSLVAIVPQDVPSLIEVPMGTGPYRMESFSEHELTLRASDNYWDEIPSIEKVKFVFLSDQSERLEAFSRGDVDFVYSVHVADSSEFTERGDYRFVSESGLYVSYLQFRVDRPPFDDIRIRQAINLAIDRDRLVNEALEGGAQPANQLLSPHIFGYVPNLPVTQADPEKVRALLAEAGYPHGIDLDIHINRGRLGRALVTYINEMGIRLKPIVMDWPDLYAKLQTGEVDFYLGSFGCPSGDASELFDNKLHSFEAGGAYGMSNSMGYSNPLLDGLVEDAGRTFNMKKRKEIFARAMEITLKDLPMIPLIVGDDTYLTSSDLRWNPRMDRLILAQEMSFQ